MSDTRTLTLSVPGSQSIQTSMPSFDRWFSSRWEEVEAMAEDSRNARRGDRGLPRVISVRSAPMIGRERQTAIYLQGVGGRRPRVPLDPERLEAAARKAMRDDAYAYVAAGAGAQGDARRRAAVRAGGPRGGGPGAREPRGLRAPPHRPADAARGRAPG